MPKVVKRKYRHVGIVGAEEAKFTFITEAAAKALIRELLQGATAVVSGACHLGGIDVWAAEAGKELGLTVVEFPPNTLDWEGRYRPRNISIAERSDETHCITLAELPPRYTGMRFDLCYHCRSTRHVKSGSCWTANYARGLGKPSTIWVITKDGKITKDR